MRFHPIWFGLSFLFLLTISTLVLATENVKPTNELIIQKDKIFDPNTLTFDSVKLYEKNFEFDHNHYTVSDQEQKKIDEVENFIQKNSENEYQRLSNEEQQALGKIVYKLGSFYLRVLRQPDKAIPKLDLALSLLKTSHEKIWATNYIAYAYEQKYANLDEDKDKEKALSYANKVISKLAKTQNKELAFAYYVKGLTENAAGNYDDAENNLKEAIKIYETIPNHKDDQYAIMKNSLAEIVLFKDGRDDEALNLLLQAEKHWRTKKLPESPYAAKNLLALGQANLKLGNSKLASDEVKKAIAILKNLSGNKNALLAEAYQVLSDAYKKQGDQKLADDYEHKADALNKG